MKVYVSWSGDLGRRASDVLSIALRQLIPSLELWSFPGSDSIAGTRWIDQTEHAIRASEIALVCLTNDSRTAPWLLFELGVMAGSGATVVPWLVDIEYSDLAGPLAQFQAIRSDSRSFFDLADLVCRKASMELPPLHLVERWAEAIEAEISQLVGRGRKGRDARPTEEWLAQIEEARRTRNLDQLRSLRGDAQSAALSDLTVLRALLKAYRDLQDFGGLLETFESFRSIVAGDPGALSLYAWGLLRTGQSSTAIGVLEEAQKLGTADPEVKGLLARAYKDQWRERSNQGNFAAAQESLHRAAEAYTEGFKMDPAVYYLGLNAVELLHLLGDDRSLAIRDELLPLVQTSLEGEAARTGSNYWTTASMLELAVVRGSQVEAEALAEQLPGESRASWEIETTVQQLRLLSDAKAFEGNTREWVRNLVASLEHLVASLER